MAGPRLRPVGATGSTERCCLQMLRIAGARCCYSRAPHANVVLIVSRATRGTR